MNRTAVLSLLLACAAYGQRTSGLEIWSSGVRRQAHLPPSSTWYTTGNASRVFISPGGATGSAGGSVNTYTGLAGSEVLMNTLYSGGITSNGTIRGANVQGGEIYLRVPDGRLVISQTHNSPATPSSDAYGAMIWTAYSGTTPYTMAQLTRNLSASASFSLYTVGTATPFLDADNTGLKVSGTFPYWSNGFSGTTAGPCPVGQFYAPGEVNGGLVINGACASISGGSGFVSLTAPDTITSTADKTIESIFTWVSGGVDRLQITPVSQTMWSSGGASRVFFASGGGGPTAAGSLRVQTGAAGSETDVAVLDYTGAFIQGDDRALYGKSTAGVIRAKLTGYDTTTSSSRLQLFGGTGGTNTMVDFQGSGFSGYFRLAMDASGTTGAYGSGGFLSSQTIALGVDPLNPTGGWTYSGGSTLSTYYALPSGGGASDVGKVLGLTADHVTGWVSASSGAVSSVTGSGVISASPTTGAVVVSCSTCVDTTSAQSISAVKTITSSGRLDLTNAFSVVYGRLTNASWQFGGGLIGGTGRGVQISDSGVQIFNSSSVNTITLSTTGGNISATSYTANGIAGYNGTCVGLDNMVITNGIVTNCFP